MSHNPLLDLRPELAVILACCRARADGEIVEQLRKLLRRKMDWPLLLDWALWHNVTPLLFRTLSDNVPELLPTESFATLKVHFEKNRKQMRFLIEEMLSIIHAFTADGIPILPFKGPALAHELSGDASLRYCHDLDFLVRDEHVRAGITILARKDYPLRSPRTPAQERAHRRYSDQYQIVRTDGAAIVELHWAVAPSMLAVELDYDGIWQRVGRMELFGVSVLRFSRQDLLLILCVHGAKEAWRRLKWVLDVAEVVRGFEAGDWEVVYESARRQGCRRMLLSGLALANRLLGAPLPEVIHAQISADRTLRAMVGWAEHSMLTERTAAPPYWKFDRFRVASRERPRELALHVLRTIFVPDQRHFDFLRLPDSFFWCYYPIRCLHDYVLLPAWLMYKWIRSFLSAADSPSATP